MESSCSSDSRLSRRFTPRHLAGCRGAEASYRRGFDQGAAAFAHALGIRGADLENLLITKRLRAFRRGDLAEAPCRATDAERAELLELVRRIAARATG
jgi:hypothetical protein